jgi:hypothetical protein
MKTTALYSKRLGLLCLVAALAALFQLCTAQSTNAQTTSTSAVRSEGFASAQDAANALVDAAEKYDVPALEKILGPDANDIIHTGEPARDAEVAKAFAAQARTKMNVKVDRTKRLAKLEIGEDEWPFPVPVVKVGPKWHFDSKSGVREVFIRRIGRNELDAITICRGYVVAQNEYALTKHDGGVNQYAQRIIATPGKQDGLAWQNPDGTWDGPVGENIAKAIQRGYTSRTEPYHGYFFKILKGQGPAAPLGQLDYLIKGAMIGGFALIAAPAQYRNTGVMTFMVSQDGVVYQKDLGPKTLELFQTIDRFNPDKTWTPLLEPVDVVVKRGE